MTAVGRSRASLAVRVVEWYQRVAEHRVSPCRFTPSCSTYAHEALTRHGTRCGAWLALRRLLRCHPFGPSGFDPVPEASTPDRVSAGTAGPLRTHARGGQR